MSPRFLAIIVVVVAFLGGVFYLDHTIEDQPSWLASPVRTIVSSLEEVRSWFTWSSLPDCPDAEVQTLVGELTRELVATRLGFSAQSAHWPPTLRANLAQLRLHTILDRGTDATTGDQQCRVQVLSAPGSCEFAWVSYSIAEDVNSPSTRFLVTAQLERLNIDCWHPR